MVNEKLEYKESHAYIPHQETLTPQLTNDEAVKIINNLVNKSFKKHIAVTGKKYSYSQFIQAQNPGSETGDNHIPGQHHRQNRKMIHSQVQTEHHPKSKYTFLQHFQCHNAVSPGNHPSQQRACQAGK